MKTDLCSDCLHCRVKNGVEYCTDPHDENRGIVASYVRNDTDDDACGPDGAWFTPAPQLDSATPVKRVITINEAVLKTLPEPAETLRGHPGQPLMIIAPGSRSVN